MDKKTREIKFRIWDKNNKVMGKLKRIDWDNGFEGKPAIFGCFENKECYWIHHYAEYELLEYTGLKDKNGKEIFEGDIVKWNDTHPICLNCKNENSEKLDITQQYCPNCGEKISRQDYSIIGEVVFESNRWNFQHKWDDGICEKMLETTEVIGNIYENPKLFEENE